MLLNLFIQKYKIGHTNSEAKTVIFKTSPHSGTKIGAIAWMEVFKK